VRGGGVRSLTEDDAKLFRDGEVRDNRFWFLCFEGFDCLQKHGLFVCALIKKRIYWPTMVPGEAIRKHYEDKEAGTTNTIQGMLDGHPYTIWGTKEPDYVMSMVVTGGALNDDESCKLASQTWTEMGEKNLPV